MCVYLCLSVSVFQCLRVRKRLCACVCARVCACAHVQTRVREHACPSEVCVEVQFSVQAVYCTSIDRAVYRRTCTYKNRHRHHPAHNTPPTDAPINELAVLQGRHHDEIKHRLAELALPFYFGQREGRPAVRTRERCSVAVVDSEFDRYVYVSCTIWAVCVENNYAVECILV